MKKLAVLFLCLLFALSPSLVYATQTYDMATSTNYNLRFDGGSASEYFPTGAVKAADLDNDGKLDILVAGSYADNNSRTNSGSVYVIYDSLLETFSGSGNNIDLSNSSNYNLRFDGVAGDLLGDWSLNVADLDNNGRKDILIGAIFAGNNSRSRSGSLYVIYDSLIDDYSGTGNNIDLATSSNYNLRFDGAAANDSLSFANPVIGDLNNDAKQDILIPAQDAKNNSRNYSGSLYLIYNSLISSYSGIGNNIDLATSSNYNLRFDGAADWDRIGKGSIGLSDLDNDGRQDILVGAPAASNNSRTTSGSLYVIYNSLISYYSGTGNNIDLASPSNYNLRFDGATAAATGEYFNLADWTPVYTADLDNNGKQDLLVGEPASSNNSRSDSGCFYVIYNSLLNSYSGTGNNIDMATSSNYNLRFDGATAGDRLSFKVLTPTDFNKDHKQDIFVGAYWADNNSRSKSGSLYVIYNGLFSSYAGTGNNIDMSNSANYSFRYDGAAAGDWLPHGTIDIKDLNNDGSLDLLLGDNYTDFNSRTDSGSLYVIYNFPHVITMEQDYGYGKDNTPTIRGSVTASNATVNVDGVQYRVDNPEKGSPVDWTACLADDGGFGSISKENFSCDISAALTEGEHRIYLRAQDRNGSYTASSRYPPLVFYLDRTGPEIELTQVNGSKYSSSLTSFASPPSSFFGKITDKLTGAGSNTKIASGPREVRVKLEKKNKDGSYQEVESKTLALTQTFWQADYQEISDNTKNTSNKYSTFGYTPTTSLFSGSYRLTLTGNDKAENQGTPLLYEFSLAGTAGTAVQGKTTTSSTDGETTAPDSGEALGSEETTAVQETVSPTPTKTTKLPLSMLVLGVLLVVGASLFLLF